MENTSTEPLPEETSQEDEKPTADPDMSLSREARHARWQSRRPTIDHLEDGVIEGEDGPLALFDVGDRIVVDTRTALLQGNPWLETVVGRVRSINDITGLVTVVDETSDARSPTVRYASINDRLQTIKLAPAKGNPFEPPPPDRQPKPRPQPGKRSRGRPVGSRNQPKATI